MPCPSEILFDFHVENIQPSLSSSCWHSWWNGKVRNGKVSSQPFPCPDTGGRVLLRETISLETVTNRKKLTPGRYVSFFGKNAPAFWSQKLMYHVSLAQAKGSLSQFTSPTSCFGISKTLPQAPVLTQSSPLTDLLFPIPRPPVPCCPWRRLRPREWLYSS